MDMSPLFLLGLIGIIGFFCQWLAWKVKLPAILFLLLCGILMGPVTGLLDPDALFGDLLFPLVSLSVAIILFEGSLTLNKSELKDIKPTVRNMVSYGALINITVTTLATHYLIGLSWSLSALFGALMVVTGPTVIMPMLRSVKPNAKISRTLRWEGIIIDPLGALFGVLIFEWIVAQNSSSDWLHVISIFSQTIIVGSLLGAIAAYIFGTLIRKNWIPEYLQNFAAIVFVTATFATSDSLMHESGLLAVTVMGIYLANMKGVFIRDILNFKESLTIILVSILFILLSARIDVDTLSLLGINAIGLFLVMQFLARPLKVFASTLGSTFTFKERLLLSWIGPRGIVAAAVSVVFALKLEELGIANANLLVPLTFTIIVGTVLVQSATARPLAKWLGVAESQTPGWLIIGANPVAIAIASALKDVGVNTRLCDSHWNHISHARMEGLDTYYGNPISSHADTYMELSGIGGLVGLSSDHGQNIASALRFREDFENQSIHTLYPDLESTPLLKHREDEDYTGGNLFGENITYRRLEKALNDGHSISTTLITEQFDALTWREQNPTAVMLFVVDNDGAIRWVLNQQDSEKLQAGEKVASINMDSL